jgi:hypothetical protein
LTGFATDCPLSGGRATPWNHLGTGSPVLTLVAAGGSNEASGQYELEQDSAF